MAKSFNQGVPDNTSRSCKPKLQTKIIRELQITLNEDHQARAALNKYGQLSPTPESPAYPSPEASLPDTPLFSKFPLVSLQVSATNQTIANMDPNLNLYRKASEASRIRSMNHEYQKHPQSSDGHKIPEKFEAATEKNSRLRQVSLAGRKESAWPHTLNNTFTPVLPKYHEDLFSNDLLKSRDKGFSAESSYSVTLASGSLLRPSTSIPDYQTSDIIHTKQRNLNHTVYRPSRSFTKVDYNIPTTDPNLLVSRDPLSVNSSIDGEVIRSSFRSAVTTNSSFLGTSATERSSVLTKSSSRTSIFGRDEGMSVDEAIGMYEQGFTDSGGEDNYSSRPYTRSSEKNIMPGFEPDVKDFLVLPPSDHVLIRDSAEIFETSRIDALTSPSKEEASITVKESDYGEEASPSRPVTRSATTQFDDTRDRYGFRKKTQYVSREEYEAWNKPYTVYLARRKKKWIALMRQYNLSTIDPQDFPPRSDKIKRYIRKGIPPSWRGAAWFHYAGGPAMLAKYPGVYDDLVRRSLAGDMTQTDEEIIERDLNRTFPDNIKFKPDMDPNSIISFEDVPETPILQSLRRVLRAFSIYHPKIGYCQSLNFLAGLLLLFMNEEKAFWMLNIITRIFLPGTHSLNLEGANVDLGVLMSSVKEMMPSVWAKIGNELDGQPSTPSANAPMRLPPITLCTTAWFMSCFIGTLPIETTLRVWDSFFYEGSKTLFRIALTIFKLGEPQIRAVTDPMEIFQVVQGIPRSMMDCNHLMETCFRRRGGFVKLSQDDIERGREERRRGYAEERERIAVGANMAISGVPRSKGGTKRGNIFFGRGKKERIGLPVQV